MLPIEKLIQPAGRVDHIHMVERTSIILSTRDAFLSDEAHLSRRIVLGGDPFRVREDGDWEQARNLKILRVLTAAVAPDAEMAVMTPADFDVAPPPQPAEYHWGRMRTVSAAVDAVSTLQTFLKDDLYIGFETPDALWGVIQERGGPAIDLRLHPIRFGSEMFLLVRSVGLDLTMSDKYELKSRIRVEAEYLRFVHGAPSFDQERGDELIIALQVPWDSAVTDAAGQTVAITDYIDELTLMATEASRTWIATHPHAKPDSAVLGALLTLPNARLSGSTAYELMTKPEIGVVTAISSSLLHEAQALGIKSIALRPDLSHGFPIRSEFAEMDFDTLIAVMAPFADGFRIPVHSPFGIRDLFGQVGASLTPISRAEPPPIPMTPTPLSALSDALSLGWSNPESWGVWTNQPVAVLDFSWPNPSCEALRIEFLANIICAEDRTEDDFEVWADGQCLIRSALPNIGQQPKHLSVTVERPADLASVQLVIARRGTVTPKHTDNSGDRRSLGVAIYDIWASTF